MQLHVELDSLASDTTNFESQYDKRLEGLKLAIKERLLEDWASCTWLVDDQSELLCSTIYPRVFRLENRTRAFVNEVLIRHLGQNWLDQPGLEKYKESVSSLEGDFKQKVPQFRDIDTTLFSMTLETLEKVLFQSEIYEDQITLNGQDWEKIDRFIESGNKDKLRQMLFGRRSTKVNIKHDILADYLDDVTDFEKQFLQFRKSRNHIAHNKLLTLSAYRQMLQEMDEYDATIQAAMTEFEQKNASDEQIDTWMYQLEQEPHDAEYEREYWRSRVSSETGIEIRDTSEIYELFCETISWICEGLSDRYHYDECYEVTTHKIPAAEESGMVCCVTSKASGDVLELEVSMSIDDDMGESSYLNLEAKHNGKHVIDDACIYQNGNGHEGPEGHCIADSDSEYDDSQMPLFLLALCDYIEEYLNPYLAQLASLEYEAATGDGPPPVVEFPCEECGNYGVSVYEDFLPVGKCCFCGHETEVRICQRCGEAYSSSDGDDFFCDACLDYILSDD